MPIAFTAFPDTKSLPVLGSMTSRRRCWTSVWLMDIALDSNRASREAKTNAPILAKGRRQRGAHGRFARIVVPPESPHAMPPAASGRQLFVTTALPYANGPFHLGHIMEYIQ